ncbi:hypothetical protein RJ639_028204 [Escallonia herrerae]|uniref:Uncharacterized protein n=1 Tax=Escallonia herrerae TaxID=1293975 RepID=A0AA89BE73_9ASTE|nr:hypothetical protein RJ639_028204 [Escallonia herrerae]
MVTRFMLRPPNSLPFTFLSPPRVVPNPLSLSFSFHSATATATTANQILPYGPSLRKGHKPFELSKNQSEEAIEQVPEDTDNLLDTNSFTRAFDIAALRVPSERCFALENRLRGHLLNWPRIRNIARVPGDEVDGELNDNPIHRSDSSNYDGDSDGLVALNRRIHGRAEGDGELFPSVLYRDKLVKTFNTRGFVKFRYLARMSRPKKRKKKEEVEGRDKRGSGRNTVYMVKVVEDGSGSEEEEGKDLSGLLGDEFKGRKWRGSTRLLLLDEQYADNRVEDMPEAIKAVAKEDGDQSTTSTLELVRCRLTLFYNYWQMDEILEALLPKDMIIPSAFETVGHIAHLNLRDEHLP